MIKSPSYFYYLLPLLYLCIGTIQAQTPYLSHRQYTLNDGLPSMQIFNIMQDHQGFIWLASPMGLSRFDGQKFRTYTTADGLPTNTIIDFKQFIGDDKLWLQTTSRNDSSYYFLDGKIHRDTLKIFSNTSNFGDIIMGYQSYHYLAAPLLPNQKEYFKQSVSCTLSEGKHTLWIGTWGGGVYKCDNYGTDSLRVQQILSNTTISCIFKDREHNYWFATLDNGIYLLANAAVYTYDTSNGLLHNNINALSLDHQGTLWLGDIKSNLSSISRQGIQHLRADDFDRYNRIHHIYIDEKQNKWLSSDASLSIIDDKGEGLIISLEGIKQVIATKDKQLWLGKHQHPTLLNTYEGLEHKFAGLDTLGKVNSISLDGQDNLWLGTNHGLYYFVSGKLHALQTQHPLLSKPILHLTHDQQGRLWIATDGYGIIIKKGKKLIPITKANGLTSNICRKIFIDSQDKAWVASNQGVNTISLQGMDNRSLVTQHYTKLHGLASNHINDLLVQGDSVFIATTNGLNLLRPSQLSPTEHPPSIHISKLQINNRDTTLQGYYTLPYNHNNITIHYLGLSYKSGTALKYLYQMRGIDHQWQQTDARTVQYPSLPPGRYIFRIAALDRNGTASSSSEIILKIAPPLWQQWWFKLLSLLLIIGIISTILYIIIDNIQSRSSLQRSMIASQQMALRAQMNPHFIFNALNSIQYFITQNDKKSANLYLSTFATLIRKVLNHTQYPLISLAAEIDYLHLYLQIESLRFKDKFAYQLNTSPTLDLDALQIPPMLIQPYVENALQHGLLPKQNSDRLLDIQFTSTEKQVLICEITDNGIGRKFSALAQGNRSINRKSIGTTNPAARLSLLNALHAQRITVQIIDLYGSDGTATGTQVRISMPLQYD